MEVDSPAEDSARPIKSFSIVENPSADYTVIRSIEAFGQENNAGDGKTNIRLTDLPTKKQGYQRIFIQAHGIVKEDANAEKYHASNMFESTQKTTILLQKIQKQTGANEFIFTACFAGRLMKDLRKMKFPENTKFIVLGSSLHKTYEIPNLKFVIRLKELSDQGKSMLEIVAIISRELGQTIQYGEYRKTTDNQVCFVGVKFTSKESNFSPFTIPFTLLTKYKEEEQKALESKLLEEIENALSEAKKQRSYHSKQNFMETAFLEAHLRQKTERIKFWLNKLDPNYLQSQLLCHYIIDGNFLMAKSLIENGVSLDVNTNDEDCQSPLHLAAGSGWLEMTNILLDSGANPNIQDNLGETPLHVAVINNNTEILRALLQKGADPTLTDKKGESPIGAARSGKKDICIEILLNSNNILLEQLKRKAPSSELSETHPAKRICLSQSRQDQSHDQGLLWSSRVQQSQASAERT